MIPKAKLIYGQYYDGFTWVKGKQRGVAIMGWDGDMFHSPDGTVVMSYMSDLLQDGFEPNVIATPPDGSDTVAIAA